MSARLGGLLCSSRTQGDSDFLVFHTYDSSGNVCALFQVTGSIPQPSLVARYEYDPFGNLLTSDRRPLTSDLSLPSPFGFSTRYYDRETGLVMYPLRPYSPTLGRFLTRDPIEEDGGLNLYAFVGNNPVDRVDPLGLIELWTFSGVNNWDPREQAGQGAYIDYVGRELSRRGFPPAHSIMSHSGSSIRHDLFGKGSFIGVPWSERILDKEADARIASLGCGSWCCKTIKVLMLAPKTDTQPPRSSCCNIEVEVYWNPYDPVPNQRLLQFESDRFWSRFGRAWAVNTGAGHDFVPFVDSIPDPLVSLQQNQMDYFGEDGDTTLEFREWLPTGNLAPLPLETLQNWIHAPSVDYVFVCHSQGCNIAMRLLGRVCTSVP